MPNWCYTNIQICHTDSDKVKEFFNKIDEWSKKSYKTNDFDDGYHKWLGNIVGNAGLAEWKKNKNGIEDFEPNIRCRGTLLDIELMDTRININTETAWGPMMKMWQMLVDKYLPGGWIWFSAEEPMMEIYVTNDPNIAGKYYIDIVDSVPKEFAKETSECEATEKYTIEFLQRVLKTDESDIKKLLDMYNEIEEPWFIINQWEECDISECE